MIQLERCFESLDSALDTGGGSGGLYRRVTQMVIGSFEASMGSGEEVPGRLGC